MVIFIYFSFGRDSLFLLKNLIVLKPKYHIVLCCMDGGGDGQTGNKQYLLFKVKATTYVGMKSVVKKNYFNTFSFLSCLLSLQLLVSTM